VELGVPVFYADRDGRRLSVNFIDPSGRRRSSAASYHTGHLSEEPEDTASIYDDIEDSHYDDLTDDKVYLEVLDDETEPRDQENKPELPSPRSGSRPTSREQNQNEGYEGLKDKKDHPYVHVISDNTEGGVEEIEVQDQDQETNPIERDKPSTLQDRDSSTQDQSHHETTKSQE